MIDISVKELKKAYDDGIDILDGLLTLKGLRLIYDKNRPENA